MPSRVHVSYLGLVRNVISCREEEIEIASRDNGRRSSHELSEKHGDPFRASVFKSQRELRVRPPLSALTIAISTRCRDSRPGSTAVKS